MISVNRYISTVFLIFLGAWLMLTAPVQAADISASYTFKPVRIGAGGWMRGMVVDPANPQRRLARSDTHGAFRWDAGRGEWVQMLSATGMPASFLRHPAGSPAVSAVFDPSNTNIVWLAIYSSRADDIPQADKEDVIRVYRSTDGGRTFPQQGNLAVSTVFGRSDYNEALGERLAVDPNNGRVAYFASSEEGLWRTRDAGLSWSQVLSAPLSATSSTRFIRFDGGAGTASVAGQSVSTRVYLTLNSGQILKSTDGGQNFANLAGTDTDRAGTIVVAANGDLFFGANNGAPALHRITRSGVQTTAFTAQDNIHAIALDPVNPSRAFVLHQGGGLGRINIGADTMSAVGLGTTMQVTQSIATWLRPNPSRRPLGSYRSIGGVAMDNAGRLWASLGNEGVVSTVPNDASNSAANPPVWQFDAKGIEQLVSSQVIHPPGGKVVLSVFDETSFYIDDPDQFTAVPYNINHWQPSIPNAGGAGFGLSTGGGVAFCPNVPSYIANTSANSLTSNPDLTGNKYAGYSIDGGRNWQLFGSIINNAHPAPLFGGSIAVSARAAGDAVAQTNLVWLPAANPNGPQRGFAPFYSSNGGQSWQQSTSFNNLPGTEQIGGFTRLANQWGNWNIGLTQQTLIADPLIKGTFYLNLISDDDATTDGLIGRFYRSTDGGVTWQRRAGGAQIPVRTHNAQMVANPNASGDVWFIDGWGGYKTLNGVYPTRGLWRSTNGGDSFQAIPGFEYTYAISLGKAATTGGYPSIYVAGTRAEGYGIYRSTNIGQSWDKISAQPYGSTDHIGSIAASMDEFGLVHVALRGSSAVYGKPTNASTNNGGARPAEGALISFKTKTSNLFVAAENAGSAPLMANRTVPSVWEQFQVSINAAGEVALKASANNLYVCAENAGSMSLIANRNTALGSWERFEWLDQGNGSFALRSKANARFVQVQNNGELRATGDLPGATGLFVRQ